MKKTEMLIVLVCLIFIAGCAKQAEITAPNANTGNKVIAAESNKAGETLPPVKEVVMTVKQFGYDPSTIEVNKGDKVRIKITSLDVTHGFSLPDYGINERIEPNNEVVIEFIADKRGTFPFKCSIPCGEGHSRVKGTLIVN